GSSFASFASSDATQPAYASASEPVATDIKYRCITVLLDRIESRAARTASAQLRSRYFDSPRSTRRWDQETGSCLATQRTNSEGTDIQLCDTARIFEGTGVASRTHMNGGRGPLTIAMKWSVIGRLHSPAQSMSQHRYCKR